MIPYICPYCQKSYELTDDRAGGPFECTQCGRLSQVPRPEAVGSWPAAGAAPHVAAPPAAEFTPGMPPAAPVPALPPLTVRLRFRDFSRKFVTNRSPDEVRAAVEEMLDVLDLDLEKDGEIHGKMNHSYSTFMTSTVRGELFLDKRKNELVLDFTVSNSVTAVAILLCLLFWPLLVIGAILLPNQVREEIGRKLTEAFRDMEQELTG